MKKVLAIILAVMMMFTLVSLTSCTDNTVSDDVNDESNVNGENGQNADANQDDQNGGDVSNDNAVSDLAYIQDKGTLVIGITEYAPMNYKENDEWTGFDTEFALAVAEKLGVTAEFVEIEWDRLCMERNDADRRSSQQHELHQSLCSKRTGTCYEQGQNRRLHNS